LSTRWLSSDIDRYAQRRRERLGLAEPKRNENGFVDVKVKRPKHTNEYLYHAAAYCRHIGIPEPVGEWHFHPTREWRLDLAWIDSKIGLEINGGNWVQGAHARGAGLREEYDKGNAAVLCGWRVLKCEPGGLADVIQMVAQLLRGT